MYKRVIDTSLTQTDLNCEKEEGISIQLPLAEYVTSGLTAYYKFTEGSGITINDTQENYDGEFLDEDAGSPVWDTGYLDSAIDYDGNSQMVTTGTFANLSRLSIDTWVYVDATDGTGVYTVCGKGEQTSEDFALVVRYNFPDVRFFVRDDFFGDVYSVTASITRSTFGQSWHHIVGIANSLDDMTLFIDNVKHTGDWLIMFVKTSTNPLVIGAREDNPQGIPPSYMQYFDGKIDELKIYNKGLSDDEVEQNYNYSGGGYGPPQTGGLIRTTMTQEPTLSATLQDVNEYQESVTGGSHVTSGLVSYWTLDEGTGTTASDSITTNDLTLVGADYWYDDGHKGKCLDVDGSSDYGKAADSPSLDITPHISVECWLNADSFSGIMQFVNKQKYIMRFEYGLCEFVPTVNGRQYQNTGVSTASMTLGEWHHVVGTYDGSKIKFYLDGLPKDTTSIAGSLSTDNFDFVVGARFRFYDRKFDGRVDEVRLYDRALSDAEILQNYNAGGVTITTKYSGPVKGEITSQTNINGEVTKLE